MKHHKIICCAFAVCLSGIALSSCSEHEISNTDDTMKVGSILLTNNTIVSQESYNPLEHNAVGVIFFTRGDSAYVVAKEEMGSECYAKEYEAEEKVSASITEISGSANTAALLQCDYETPAAQKASLYPCQLTGWYLPSAAELRLLSHNRLLVSRGLELIGGEPLSEDEYASSTQDGTSQSNMEINYYCVSLLTGYVTANDKKKQARVRPVMMIH